MAPPFPPDLGILSLVMLYEPLFAAPFPGPPGNPRLIPGPRNVLFPAAVDEFLAVPMDAVWYAV